MPLGSHLEKITLEPYLVFYIRINSKLIKDLIVKVHKNIRRNLGEVFYNLGAEETYLNMTQKL